LSSVALFESEAFQGKFRYVPPSGENRIILGKGRKFRIGSFHDALDLFCLLSCSIIYARVLLLQAFALQTRYAPRLQISASGFFIF